MGWVARSPAHRLTDIDAVGNVAAILASGAAPRMNGDRSYDDTGLQKLA